MKYFLNWWIIFILICFGTVLAAILGVVTNTVSADVTRISFIIYILFFLFTVRTGVSTYRVYKSKELDEITVIDRKQDLTWFVSDLLLTLGMLGTIIGYIYMIQVGFANMDPSNVSSLTYSLKTMAVGWGTALYTTAYGLICGLILKLQLFNITKQIESYCNHLSSACNSNKEIVPLKGMGV